MYDIEVTPSARTTSTLRPSIRFRSHLNYGLVRINRARAKFAVNLLARTLTPVKTGRARGNWVVSLNYRNTRFVWNRFDPSGYRTARRGAAKINSARLGDSIYITNSIYYVARHLERRMTSRQAPRGITAPLREALRRWDSEQLRNVRRFRTRHGTAVTEGEQQRLEAYSRRYLRFRPPLTANEEQELLEWYRGG